MATATHLSVDAIHTDPVIANAVVSAVDNCFAMCDTTICATGVNTRPTGAPGPVTGMLGVHGKVSGFVSVNMAERAAMTSVSGLLQEQVDVVNSQVIDGVGEITNIIAGGIKAGLAGTQWAFNNITVPSVIVGENYQIAYARGLEYVSVQFEIEDVGSIMLRDRLVQVAVSLIPI